MTAFNLTSPGLLHMDGGEGQGKGHNSVHNKWRTDMGYRRKNKTKVKIRFCLPRKGPSWERIFPCGLLECWMTSWQAKGQCAHFIKVQPQRRWETETAETSQKGIDRGGTRKSQIREQSFFWEERFYLAKRFSAIPPGHTSSVSFLIEF